MIKLISGLLVVLSLAATGPALARNPYPLKSDVDPHAGVAAAKRHAVQGIDVSKYQFDIDWEQV
ncbi:MAG: GH25 family lysozyme, partial [Beijerinckiaceae bacterium]